MPRSDEEILDEMGRVLREGEENGSVRSYPPQPHHRSKLGESLAQ
jgi:hypothetical protein